MTPASCYIILHCYCLLLFLEGFTSIVFRCVSLTLREILPKSSLGNLGSAVFTLHSSMFILSCLQDSILVHCMFFGIYLCVLSIQYFTSVILSHL